MQYGKVKITREDIDGGYKIEKTINIYTEGTKVYANLEDRTDYMGSTDNWSPYNFANEKDYKVYINKTVNEVINYYKESSNDTVEWLIALAEV